MKMYISSDHRGFELKQHLLSKFDELIDLGPTELIVDDDYPDYAYDLCKKVLVEGLFGILICGSGVGMSIAANKIDGIRAGLCVNEGMALSARNDDDCNVLVLDASVSKEVNEQIALVFYKTKFASLDRFMRRLSKIKAIEEMS